MYIKGYELTNTNEINWDKGLIGYYALSISYAAFSANTWEGDNILLISRMYVCTQMSRELQTRVIWNVSGNGKKRGGWGWGGKQGLTGGWDQNEPYIKTAPFSPCQKGDGEWILIFKTNWSTQESGHSRIQVFPKNTWHNIKHTYIINTT